MPMGQQGGARRKTCSGRACQQSDISTHNSIHAYVRSKAATAAPTMPAPTMATSYTSPAARELNDLASIAGCRLVNCSMQPKRKREHRQSKSHSQQPVTRKDAAVQLHVMVQQIPVHCSIELST
eukprot:GHUV01025036.1.p1 GENE.GHUV01025036.1~~GHUV01025036.1.p1  ORF type:complete len:124 (-),score=7.17 GHUV01025036.1:90-461(-)